MRKNVHEKLAEKHYKCSSVTNYKSSKTSCISNDRGFHCTCWKMWKGLGSYVLFIKCIIFFLTSPFLLLVNSSYYILSITLTQAGRQYAPKDNNQSNWEQNGTVMDDTDCQPDRIQNHQRQTSGLVCKDYLDKLTEVGRPLYKTHHGLRSSTE